LAFSALRKKKPAGMTDGLRLFLVASFSTRAAF
jgi:hypothetical protein